MSAFRHARTLIGLATAILCLTPLMTVVAEEEQLPEERLFEQMRTGEVEAARDGFDALVTARITRFNSVPPDHPQSAASRIIVASELARALRLWQAAEIEQRLRNGGAPDNLNLRMLIAGDALIEIAAVLDQVKIDLSNTADVPAWLDRRAALTSERLGNSMLETAAFLRGSSLEKDRLRLLQEAAKYTIAPATLQELDDQQGDLRRTFQIPAVAPTAPRANAIPVVVAAIDPLRDAAVRALLEDYYTTLFSGNVADLQPRFADGYWPAQELGYVAAKLSGCVLESLGEVNTSPVATDEYYVEIKGLTCIDPSRGQRTMADHLLLKREGESYRILSLDARDR